jgi:hypothetical protein
MWLQKYGDDPVVKARLEVASFGSHISRLEAMLARMDDSDILHFESLYVGTHTGRSSGSTSGNDEDTSDAKFNMYNIPKGNKSGPEKGLTHGVDLRGTITPRPGHAFIINDYSQVEPRITHWLAGNTAFLQLAVKEDIYQAAAKVMGWYPMDKFDLKEDDNQLRQVSKQTTLLTGYGAGASKFVNTCRKDGVILDRVPKDQWDLDRRKKFLLRNIAHKHWDRPEDEEWISEFITGDKIIMQWREKNPQVPALWVKLYDELSTAADRKESVHYFTLPSGRRKPYWKPHVAAKPKIVFDPETGKPSQMVES